MLTDALKKDEILGNVRGMTKKLGALSEASLKEGNVDRAIDYCQRCENHVRRFEQRSSSSDNNNQVHLGVALSLMHFTYGQALYTRARDEHGQTRMETLHQSEHRLVAALANAQYADYNLNKRACTILAAVYHDLTPTDGTYELLRDTLAAKFEAEFKTNMSTATGGSRPKYVCFAIDLSWEPLKKPACDAMLMILNDSCGDEDMIGLIDLGGQWIFKLTKKAGNEQHLIREIKKTENRNSGASLDKTIDDCMIALSQRPSNYAGWLIVLSDMYGGSVDSSHGRHARDLLSNAAPDTNFVFINSWKTGGFWKEGKPTAESRNVQLYIEAAGETGIELMADSVEQLKEAFGQVAVMMGTGGQFEEL